MKPYYFCKSILFVIMIHMICSCSRTDVFIGKSESNESSKVIEGCEIKNPETAVYKGCLKADYIYIYGSRKTNEKGTESLWIAQYSLQHELVKEYVETVDGLSLYTLKMISFPNGKYLVVGNCGNSQDSSTGSITEQVPAILDPVKKELKLTRINKGFFFDVVNEYEDFMLLTLSEQEIALNPMIDPKNYQMVQMNYEGKVLLKSNNMRIPKKEDCTLWINTNEYITANSTEISSTFLDGNKETRWKHEVKVSAQSAIEITIDENNANVVYNYVEKGRKKNRIYIFNLGSGQQQITAEKISTVVESDKVMLVSNKEFKLQASILPANTYLNHLKYETSDDAVATVTDNGIIKTHKNGNCTIYICSEDGFAEEEIQLTVSSLSFSKENYDAMVGQTKLLEIVADESIPLNSLIWKSSDENIASVNAKGEITGLQRGKTTITVASNDGTLETSCTLVVKDFMDYIKVTNSFSFIGNSNLGVAFFKVIVANQSEENAEIISCSLCYEKDDDVTSFGENKQLASKAEVEMFLECTIYPMLKPYLKLDIKHRDKVYESKYDVSIRK